MPRFFFFRQSIRIGASQDFYQGSFSVIDMARGAKNEVS
jgi:hypothetical protein